MTITKRCSVEKGCGQEKDIEDFYLKKSKGKRRRSHICKDCETKDTIMRQKMIPQLEMLKGARKRAKQKNLEFALKLNDLVIPEFCPILGIKIERNIGGLTASSNSPSIDRIDPSRGYTKDNIRIVSFRANTLKNNATVEELKKVIQYIEEQNAKLETLEGVQGQIPTV